MSKYANFSLAEFIESDTAAQKGIDNTPDFDEVALSELYAALEKEAQADAADHHIEMMEGQVDA